jgi:bifunctional non-homologous end joining protein LigD
MPKMKHEEGDSLERYRAKRSAEKTLEPFGTKQADRPQVFVMQKHRASRLHYDLRLEIGGTLKSWAVPKGPSFDPAVKRMAVHVEDHPVEYADFEGLIPEGNYGAGAMIVWDRGTWQPLEDPVRGLDNGKLLFELRGYRLRGVWTLVKTKGNTNDWLLIKKPDAYSAPEGSKPLPQESILSGLTVEELHEGKDRSRDLLAELERLGAPKKKVRPVDVKVMLAETAERPFSKTGWIFELKYDGYRLVAAKENGEAELRYRRGADSTKIFPDIARAIVKLPFERFVLDGEVVVLDEEARPSFQRLQKRVQLTRVQDIERAAVVHPATYYAFDLLAFGEFDLRGLPLVDRKRLLRSLLPQAGPIRFSDHIEAQGEELYRQVEKMKLEGVLAKKADSTYRSGRWGDWLKVRVDQTADFVVVGFTEPKEDRTRTGFGALHLGLYQDGALLYAGRVGGGFDQKQLASIRKALEETIVDGARCGGNLPPGRGHVWVEPKLVCEVRFKERTEDELLRQPVFLRMRDDKKPEECVGEVPGVEIGLDLGARDPTEEGDPEPTEAETRGDGDASSRKVPFTNLDKVFWPEEGYTKGDLIEFYRSVSDWILPYLRDRPVVLTRYPDGVKGKSFFQKDAPPFVPGWMRTERMWSEHASREIDYFICDDVETLLYLINMGSIPLHVWSSRMADLQKPDWCILDLDPKKAPFRDVVTIALAIKRLCDEIEMPSFIKTSGSTGLHVLLPLGGRCTYEQSRSLGELFARVIVDELPEIATITRQVGARGERVYIDYLQNGHGRLLVSALSVRPVPGAQVSTMLEWSEVNEALDPKKFTIETVPERLARMKVDPVIAVLRERPKLGDVLARLSARFQSARAR